jgi:hypothetical protein
MLGDIPAINVPDAPSQSVFSMDYYRQKATEFQVTLTALDRAYTAANAAIQSGALSQEDIDGLQGFIDDYESRRMWVRGAAEAINAGAAAINAAGGRFPALSVPQTLGIAPLAVPVAIAAGLATAAAIIVWGNAAIKGVNERLARAQLLDGATPEQRAALARAMAESDAAVSVADSSMLGGIAPLVKWGAIALAAWLAYRAWQGSKGAD